MRDIDKKKQTCCATTEHVIIYAEKVNMAELGKAGNVCGVMS